MCVDVQRLVSTANTAMQTLYTINTINTLMVEPCQVKDEGRVTDRQDVVWVVEYIVYMIS